jgi:hypothetical protein
MQNEKKSTKKNIILIQLKKISINFLFAKTDHRANQPLIQTSFVV